MQGVITDRDVVLHGLTMIRVWGFGAYLRCMRAIVSGRRTTFLALVGQPSSR